MNQITTISMKPAPPLIRAALDNAGIPLTYNDDHTVTIPSGPGFDSNGNLTIPEGHVLSDILNGLVTLALEKHLEESMILPTNVARLRQVSAQLIDLRYAGRSEDAEWIDEIRTDIERVADNLDPAKRTR
jgi:hypothetical protein